MASDLPHQVGKLGEKAQAGIDAAAAQAKEMARRGAAIAQETARAAGETGAAAWEVAQQAGAEVKTAASDAYAQAERGARELAARVEERPLTALLVAGALGYALAYLMHSRR